MATGCCGVKKQKLNTSHVLSHTVFGAAGGGGGTIVCTSSGTMIPVGLQNGCCPGTVDWDDDPDDDVIDERDQTGPNSQNGPSAGTRSHFHSNNAIINGHHHPDQACATHRSCATRVVSMDMLIYCFDVLHSYLQGADPPKPPKFPNEQFPLFVTWKVGKERKLRGCIGTFNCTSLQHGLREYSITSACKDSRFDPISPEEFTRLHCSVSLLMDFEMADHVQDWDLGVHGIRIEFHNDRGSKKAATYLPEVAVEQGWNHVQTVDSLLRKGGFKGNITPDIRAAACVIRFQSDKLTISYAEYVAHKQRGPRHPTTNGFLMGRSGGGACSSSRRPTSDGVDGHYHRYNTRGSAEHLNAGFHHSGDHRQ